MYDKDSAIYIFHVSVDNVSFVSSNIFKMMTEWASEQPQLGHYLLSLTTISMCGFYEVLMPPVSTSEGPATSNSLTQFPGFTP